MSYTIHDDRYSNTWLITISITASYQGPTYAGFLGHLLILWRKNIPISSISADIPYIIF